MAIDLVSLALISLVSVACPIIAGLIPGKPIPETVLLLLAGAALAGAVMAVMLPFSSFSQPVQVMR